MSGAGFRVGLGYDSHRFDPERRLVLAGVDFPDAPGLRGFSDGDAVAHAVIDALLGAASLGDVGSHFPTGDPQWKDADSMDLLARAAHVLHEAGWNTHNVDITVICESPRIGPRSGEMRAALARVLQVGEGAVSVKGKSNEGMGWIGRGEGIAVQAVALVARLAP
jgi:2-C-methyl-D-erythritol 2,4-cyclodiphosphate synthase